MEFLLRLFLGLETNWVDLVCWHLVASMGRYQRLRSSNKFLPVTSIIKMHPLNYSASWDSFASGCVDSADDGCSQKLRVSGASKIQAWNYVRIDLDLICQWKLFVVRDTNLLKNSM